MNNEDLKQKLKKIRIFVMDVDGTMTDGSMYYSQNGEELKRFFVRDGMGIILLQKAGIKTALLTSEDSDIAKKRGEKLKIDSIITGSKNKTRELKQLVEDFNLEMENVAYMGDDVNDLHAMKLAGFSACPSDAVESVKSISDYASVYPGGRGAVREICELILKAQDKSVIVFENW